MDDINGDFDYGFADTGDHVVEPFQFEPLPHGSQNRPSHSNSTSEGSTEDSSDEEDFNQNRIGNTDWCQCNHCPVMPTGRESICCNEVDDVYAKTQQAGCDCITLVEGFQHVCLNPEVILCAIYQYIEDEHYVDDHQTHELYRYISYRQFVRWIWHYLGRHQRKILPACVVGKIRSAFPSQQYTGFRYPEISY